VRAVEVELPLAEMALVAVKVAAQLCNNSQCHPCQSWLAFHQQSHYLWGGHRYWL
jgi:hypothetical protein